MKVRVGKKTIVDKFLVLMPQLQPIEVFGLAKIFGVKLTVENTSQSAPDPATVKPEARPAQDIIEDIILSFGLAKPKVQKQIVAMMAETSKAHNKDLVKPLPEGETTDGTSAKD